MRCRVTPARSSIDRSRVAVDAKAQCGAILKLCDSAGGGDAGYRLARTKVFAHAQVIERLDAVLLERLRELATRLAAMARGLLARANYERALVRVCVCAPTPAF